MLTLTFLGVGDAFSRRNYQTNVLVEAWTDGPGRQHQPDDTLLVDFGSYAPRALHQLKDKAGFEYLGADDQVNYAALRRVFVTHQHADHIGGLIELALLNRYGLKNRTAERPFRPQLISTDSILIDLWDQSLKGGLSATPGRYALLPDYFFVQSLQPGQPDRDRFTMLKRYDFVPVPTDHIQVQRKYDWPSYGLHITDRESGESVFYSSDTRFDYPAYVHYLHEAKLVFHDVQLTPVANPVHALLEELRTMPADVKKKTVLCHYSDEWDNGQYEVVGREFAGFAEAQRRYVLFE